MTQHLDLHSFKEYEFPTYESIHWDLTKRNLQSGKKSQAKGLLLKLTASNSNSLKCKICKSECDEKDSHCCAQQEQGQIAMRTSGSIPRNL